jgi:predicted dinucleotide-utilizing enzyme
MDIRRFNPQDMPRFSFDMPRQLRDLVTEQVLKVTKETVEKALTLGIEAFKPEAAARGIDYWRPLLHTVPTHMEGYDLVIWTPTGEAIMFIGEPRLQDGVDIDVTSLKAIIEYELVKAEDRPWLTDRSNGGR